MKDFFDMLDEIPAEWWVATVLATALACWAIEIWLRPRKQWWQG